MRDPNEQTVAEKLRGHFNGLTRAERQLAVSLLANYPVSGLGSVSELAKLANVSGPTVVRMAQKIGFAGFSELQAALRSEVEETISNPISKQERWTRNAPDTHILNRFADAVIDNLKQTLQQLDTRDFDHAVRLLTDRERAVHIVGGRITRALSDYFFTHLQVIRDDVIAIASNSNTWPHYLLNMKPGDVVVVFDIRRYEHDILRFVDLARERGAVVIVFTDQWTSPAAVNAEYVFNARIEAPSAWDSSVVIMFILEAMIEAMTTSTWDVTRERMNTLEKLFDKTKMFSKSS